MTQITHLISSEDHQRITNLIRASEKKTAGEIFAVVAQSSDDYFYVSGFFAGLWALVFGLLTALVAPVFQIQISAQVLVAAQVASFATFMAVFYFFPQWRLWFVPRSIAYRRASANAVRQFLAHGIHNTQGRSGVLLFVSVAERYAEVIADSGIYEKVGQGEWDAMVVTLTDHAAKDDLAEGFMHAIADAASLLTKYFPPVKGQKNELDDKLVEI